MNLFFTEHKEKIFTITLITLVVLLIGSNAFTAYFLYQRVKEANNSQEPLPASSNQQTKGAEVDNETSGETTVSAPDNTSNVETIKPIIDPTKGAITVAWKEWPAKASGWDILNLEIVESKFKGQKDSSGKDIDINTFIGQFTVYNVGKVQEGAYKGNNLFVVTYREEGPAFRDTMFRVIKTEKDAIILTNYSDKPYGLYEKVFVQNGDITIKNFEPPQFISIPNSSITFIKAKEEPFLFASAYKDIKPLFKYDGEHYVYKDQDKNCFIVKAPDDTAREYYFEIKFFTTKEDTYQQFGSSPVKMAITWLNGSNNTDEYYFKQIGGCGTFGCYNYSGITKNELIEVGITSSADDIYTLKDKNSAAFKNIYANYYPGWDSETKQQKQKEPFDQFLKKYSLLYWQDPFGDFIEFINSKYIPAVECGKPVIYLYPEKESDISVWVNPTGGFKITEPAYNNGWQVKAKPNGEIYNYGDSKIYPYLFWEGYGLNYQRQQEGFVVAKSNVKNFLNEKLLQLGLIKKEADEFIEFWLPRMQEKPYYFITFVPQDEFDKLAPLAVSPKPNTIIRVFMDYEGLDEHREVEAQKIITPERKGFVVVEWGGAMHK